MSTISNVSMVYKLAGLEGEALTLLALINTVADLDMEVITARTEKLCKSVSDLVWSDSNLGKHGLTILESIESTALTLNPSCWLDHMPEDISIVFNEEHLAFLHDETEESKTVKTCATSDKGWSLNGQRYYGGCIDAGEEICDLVYACECPACGAKAQRTEYDRVEGGSLNSYVKTQCNACGHHSDSGRYF
ncbi:hypothetical protein EHW66_16810 [Erwinia psidii]|uniref:hypothetical protein n=1 Tax=Erwinia psidii TaxID=69224 RepID=UPI00226BAAF3|nr:hypothetical protein [Erwinia psidii]MCX8966577.1 hypothetical protein [Erwinia psidii]